MKIGLIGSRALSCSLICIVIFFYYYYSLGILFFDLCYLFCLWLQLSYYLLLQFSSPLFSAWLLYYCICFTHLIFYMFSLSGDGLSKTLFLYSRGMGLKLHTHNSLQTPPVELICILLINSKCRRDLKCNKNRSRTKYYELQACSHWIYNEQEQSIGQNERNKKREKKDRGSAQNQNSTFTTFVANTCAIVPLLRHEQNSIVSQNSICINIISY